MMYGFRTGARLGAIALVAGAGLAMVPAAAHAAGGNSIHDYWVNGSSGTTFGRGTSCANPGYTTVQSAVDAAEGSGVSKPVVHVCSGTYTEQVSIDSSTSTFSLVTAGPNVSLVEPASPTSNTTCAFADGGPAYIEVSLCGSQAASKVTINGFDIQALSPEGTCVDDLYGVFVGNGNTLTLTGSSIEGAGASPLNGCQGGVGVGAGRTSAGQTGHLVLSNDTISQYQKAGVVVDGTDSTATITGTTVQGIGETDQIAQNGIQISRGAVGKISHSTVSGNECDNTSCGPDGATDTQSAGVLLYQAGVGSSVSSSTVSDNDIGVFGLTNLGTSPPKAEFSIASNTFDSNRYEAIDLDGSFTSITGNTIAGTGEVGIELDQYAGDLPIVVTAKADQISGQTEAAVYISSDNDPSDAHGRLSLINSKISGNPSGASVVGSIKDDSSSFSVTLKKDS